jgi:gag-polypeptide of LTR copia-type
VCRADYPSRVLGITGKFAFVLRSCQLLLPILTCFVAAILTCETSNFLVAIIPNFPESLLSCLFVFHFSLSLFGSEKITDDKNFFKSSQIIISVRLTENYLLWSRQILMHLKGQRLTRYVIGTTQKPEVGSEKNE